jgi:plasmid stabilization system protein ParE
MLRRRDFFVEPRDRYFESATDSQDDPHAAQQIAERIVEATRRLRDYPYISHPGDDPARRVGIVPSSGGGLYYERVGSPYRDSEGSIAARAATCRVARGPRESVHGGSRHPR